MSNIRGAVRQQYIDNWLRGNDDPDVEVKPTRVDGKYIVRYRNLPQLNSGNPSPENTSEKVEDEKQKPDAEKDISSSNSEKDISGSNSEKDISGSNSEKDISSSNSEKDISSDLEGRPHQRWSSISEKPVPEDIASSISEEPVTKDVMQEILKQLKIINDERQAKQLKKEQKKQLQQAIRKEFVRHRVMVEDPEPYIEPEPPQVMYVDRKPIKVRRRLNLLERRS